MNNEEVIDHSYEIIYELFKFLGKPDNIIIYFNVKTSNNIIKIKGSAVHIPKKYDLFKLENWLLRKYFNIWNSLEFIDFQHDFLDDGRGNPRLYGINFEIFFTHKEYENQKDFQSSSLSITMEKNMDLNDGFKNWKEKYQITDS